eukprot:938152-Rhodomonas_salina.1
MPGNGGAWVQTIAEAIAELSVGDSGVEGLSVCTLWRVGGRGGGAGPRRLHLGDRPAPRPAHVTLPGLGLGVQGLGSRVTGVKARADRLGYRVQRLWLRVEGLEPTVLRSQA